MAPVLTADRPHAETLPHIPPNPDFVARIVDWSSGALQRPRICDRLGSRLRTGVVSSGTVPIMGVQATGEGGVVLHVPVASMDGGAAMTGASPSSGITAKLTCLRDNRRDAPCNPKIARVPQQNLAWLHVKAAKLACLTFRTVGELYHGESWTHSTGGGHDTVDRGSGVELQGKLWAPVRLYSMNVRPDGPAKETWKLPPWGAPVAHAN